MSAGEFWILLSGQDYKIDPHCYYSHEHLWVRFENQLATIGVSDLLRAQVGGGHIVGVKTVGTLLVRGDEIAGWDVSKATMSLVTPLSGTIVEVNERLAARPDLGCADPYGAGWIVKVNPIPLG
jgi:glycine cleavage system H protein